MMEIVNIDAATFEAMLSKFEDFASRMEALCRLHGEKDLSDWLDNQDVCLLLKISPRTLQTLRDNGTLIFTRINHKIYYRPQDVEWSGSFRRWKKNARLPPVKARKYNLKNTKRYE